MFIYWATDLSIYHYMYVCVYVSYIFADPSFPFSAMIGEAPE